MRYSILFVDNDDIFNCYFFWRTKYTPQIGADCMLDYRFTLGGNENTTLDGVKSVIF
jgi:hypothetical protein